MPTFTSIVKSSLAGRSFTNWAYLWQETQIAFGARFVDANQTDGGANWAVYLTSSVGCDQAALDSVIAAHNDSGQTAQQQAQAQISTDANYWNSNLATLYQSLTDDLASIGAVTQVAQLVPYVTRLLQRQQAVMRYLRNK